jgi:putative FmdB family regulatory protein
MPMYEYECSKCGSVFEKLEKFSDEPLKKHQGCGGKVKRLISAPGFQFKGSGWYVTDYARGSGGSGSGADSSAKGDSGSSSSTDSGSSDSSSKSSSSSSDSSSSSSSSSSSDASK